MDALKASVLNVGQCSFDHGNITRVIAGAFEATVDSADTADEAFAAVRDGSFNLVLINRIFDGDGSEGMELIRRLQVDDALSDTPVMLVSNHDDAQEKAIALGAKRGFGKDDLGNPGLVELLTPFLGQAQSESR